MPKLCGACGSKIVMKTGFGRVTKRTIMRNGFEWFIPDEFALPTCLNCGDKIMDSKTADKLDELFEKKYQELTKKGSI